MSPCQIEQNLSQTKYTPNNILELNRSNEKPEEIDRVKHTKPRAKVFTDTA